jgi:hypothetical protein
MEQEQEKQPQPFNQSLEMSTETKKTSEITQEEKERFLKSVLTDKPYEETINLFDGQMYLKFRAMSVDENSDVVNQIVNDKKNGIAADNDAYFITISTYRMALSLVSVDNAQYSSITKDNYTPSNEKDTYILARSNQMRLWSTPKLAIFLDAFQTFEAKLLKLTNEVQTVNFWKAST